MKRISLVRLPSPFLIDDRVFPPLGLMAVGTGLKVRGYDVSIYDGEIDNIPLDFDYYGFGPTVPEYSYALELKKKIKSSNPKAKVVIGGPFATVNPLQCVADGFDTVVVGDGEIVAEKAFMGNEQIIVGEELPLDDYPTIDRSLLDIKKYRYFLNERLATTIMTSQGCPYRCAFCCKNYQTVRLRSSEKVIEEVRMLHSDYGYNALAFPEDLFILDRGRVEAIGQCLSNLGIIWRCLIRADTLVRYGDDFVKMMADCGCISAGMGIESGSPQILKNVNKKQSVPTIKKAVTMLKRHGIMVKGFFIVGLPGETQGTLNETKAFLDEMELDSVDIKIYQPYPNTLIWDNKDQYDISWSDGLDYSKQFYKGRPEEYYGNIYTSALTNEQIRDEWIAMEAQYKKGG
jgi:anaerobic magnesium-protoporphyrin IX monomethyl ester cyclase